MTGYGGVHERDDVPGSRDLETAVACAFPPTLAPFAVAVTLGAPVDVLAAVPSGVWRVVQHAAIILASANVNGAWIGVRRGGVVTPIAGAGAFATSYITTLTHPITLQPGDALCVGVNLGGPTTLTGGVAYVDVPIPPGESV